MSPSQPRRPRCRPGWAEAEALEQTIHVFHEATNEGERAGCWHPPVFVEVPAATYLFVWFLSQTFRGTLAGLAPADVGGIAFWAHVGGFLGGVALHRLFILPRYQRPRPLARDEYGIEGAWAT